MFVADKSRDIFLKSELHSKGEKDRSYMMPLKVVICGARVMSLQEIM
jgi:hypothetical protein